MENQPRVVANGISKKSSSDDLKIPNSKTIYIKYSEAIAPVISKIYKTEIQSFLTEGHYRDLLNSIFQEELEKIPLNLEKYVVLNAVRIHLHCEICAVEISYYNCVKSCMKEVFKHIKGWKHKKNVKTLSFDSSVSNFNLDGAISLPYDMFSEFPDDLIEEKQYFKTCLYLFFKCKVCRRKFSGCNNVLKIRKAIYNHINEWEHVSNYMKTFPKLDYSVGISSRDVILSSIDSIYEMGKTFVSKELYLDVLYQIFQDKLDKIPEHTEKSIVIKLDLSLNCNICMRKRLLHNYKDIQNQITSHIGGKKHFRQWKLYKNQDCDTSEIDKFSKSIIDNDVIKVPEDVLFSLLGFLKMNDYEAKVKKFISGNFLFHAWCIVCDQMMVTTENLSNVQQVIYSHINNKKHISAAIKRIIL